MAVQIDPALTSVIMVSCYTGPTLERAVAAVLAQTESVELIVVNNGNPPEVEAALAAKAREEPRLRLVTGQGNVGLGKGCNMGARVARGSFLLFLRPDSLLPPDAVALMRKQAAQCKSPFMLGARLMGDRDKDLREARRPLLTPLIAFVELLGLAAFFPKLCLNLHKESLPPTAAPTPAISGAFMFLAARDFWRLKGFDSYYFTSIADMDFCLRFRRAEGEIYFVPGVVVKRAGMLRHPDSDFQVKKRAQGTVHYFHENFGHAYPQPVLWLLDALIWMRPGLRLALIEIGKRLSHRRKKTVV